MGRKEPPKPEAGFGGLAAALAAQGFVASAEAARPAEDPAPAEARPLRGKLVLRVERKGRGGKTATLLSGPGLQGQDLDALSKALRRALGCGAAVEGDAIALQGDQIAGAEAFLRGRGATQVVRGT